MSTLPSVLDGLDLRQRMLLWLLVRETPPYPVADLIGRYRALANDNVADAGLEKMLLDLSRPDLTPYPLVQVSHGEDERPGLTPSEFGARFLFGLLKESDHPARPVAVEIPILLLNGYRNALLPGIGEIPPHNLGELQRVVAMGLLEAHFGRWEVDVERVLTLCPGPDFPTGGVLWADEMVGLYETGREDLRLAGMAHVEQHGVYPVVVVTDRLPNMSASDLYQDVSRRVAEGKLGNVHDLQLHEHGEEVRLEIKLEPGEAVAGPLQSLMAGPLARSQAYQLAGRSAEGRVSGIVELLDEYVSRAEQRARFESRGEARLEAEWHQNLVSHPFLELDRPWRRVRRTRIRPE